MNNYDDSALKAISKEIDKKLKLKEKIIIGIDGRCGSGKSTLAQDISREYGATIIRMDDFFLPPEIRTPERENQPGGNVHYERFMKQVYKGLLEGREIKYDVYSCKEGKNTHVQKAGGTRVTVIEGAYSMRLEIRDIYDLKVFMDIDSKKQEERIKSRNGEAIFENFKNKWIPMEEKYINYFGIKECCDIIFKTY